MSATNRLASDLKRIVHDSEELLHTTKDAMGDKAQAVRERVAGAIDATKRTDRDLEAKTIEGAKCGRRDRDQGGPVGRGGHGLRYFLP